jgi:hypothetical protein
LGSFLIRRLTQINADFTEGSKTEVLGKYLSQADFQKNTDKVAREAANPQKPSFPNFP